ncbi:hypothetical protein FKR81_35995 [Lentzea tibetensis]|uniref:Uncharacterized protein n=1 Tax=Lentzea tibetensis TaxID=2591470 RepID=A0A563EJS8_9PSEU|nr:nuclear transport factor 2 family protein [Lentzea tibetensis]TWP46343.1 hypothetical protein FKR81_35995 [Lentzea tibetensis]
MNVRLATTIAAVLAVVAFGYAAWAGVSWYGNAHGDTAGYAGQRDEALMAGQVGINNFLTLDYRKVDEDLNRWLSSSTGELRSEIDKDRESRKKQLVDAKTITTSKVLGAAVTELDDRSGKAKVIAVVESTVTPEGGEAVRKVNRYVTELTRTEDGWKLSQLGPLRAGGV